MASVDKTLDQMRREPIEMNFGDLKKACEAYFGKPRQSGSSHAIFKTPWGCCKKDGHRWTQANPDAAAGRRAYDPSSPSLPSTKTETTT